MRRFSQILLATVVCWSFSAGIAHATFVWQTPEAIPATTNGVGIGPDGTGLLFGYAAGSGNLAVRPPDGPVSAPQTLPAGFLSSVVDRPTATFAANGDAVLADYTTHRLAFRPAGAATSPGPAQDLGVGFGPATVAVTPAGDALLATDGYLNGDVHAVARPAGAASTANVAGAQGFGAGHIYNLGAALDPAGGGVIVFQGTLGLEQSVLDPLTHIWGTPTAIPNPAGVTGYAGLRLASAPTGHAVLAWRANGATPEDTVIGTVRAPGGGFGAPVALGTSPQGIGSLAPAVTSTGYGLVAYTAYLHASGCPGPGDEPLDDFGVFGVSTHDGNWGTPAPLGPSSFPTRSVLLGVASAGDRIALNLDVRDGGADMCSYADNRRSLRISRVTAASALPQTDGLTYATESGSGVPEPGLLSASSTGAVLLTYALGGTTYALAGRDPAAFTPAEPSSRPPSGPPSAPPPPGTTPVFKPRTIVVIPAKLPNPPVATLICPPSAGGECVVHVAYYLAFGGRAAVAKSRPAVKIGTVDARLKAGTRRRVAVKLTAAGKRAVRVRRPQRLRIVVTTTVAGRRDGFTTSATLRAARRPR